MNMSFHQPYRHQALSTEIIPPFRYVSIVGEYEATPFLLRLKGKPRYRRLVTTYQGHVAQYSEYEYAHTRISCPA